MTDEDRKKKILIVDDEEDIRIFLETLFDDNDYDTCVASDGDEAIKMLDDVNPDLITLDIQMPNETGTRFYRRLMKNHKHASTPVIIISGVAGRHLATSEPVAVFDKPIDKDRLLEVIHDTIG